MPDVLPQSPAMMQRYAPTILVLASLALAGGARAQFTSYERTVNAGAFSIEPSIRSAQLAQGEGTALLAVNAEIGTLGDADMLLQKIDATGTVTHSLSIGDMGGQGYHDVGMEVVQQGDAYFICGYTRSIDVVSPPTFTAFLLKTDTALNLLWQRNYLLPGPLEIYANAMTVSASGDLIIAGQVYDGTDFLTLVMKVSATDGAVLWANRYGMEYGERVYCVRELPGGDILLSGNVVLTFELVLPFAFKVDADGDFRWGRYYNYPPMNIVEQSNFHFMHARTEDDILLCGHTDVLGSGAQDGYIVNIDSSGTINWARTYGTPAFDLPSTFHYDDAASELVMLGHTGWFTAAGAPTAMAMRIAPGGLLLDAQIYGDTTGLVQNAALITTQRLGPNTRFLAGWRGFPGDLYYTGVDNDLVNTCSSAPVSPFSPAHTTTSGAFVAAVSPIVPQENNTPFNTSTFNSGTVLCDNATTIAEGDVLPAPFAVVPNPATTSFELLAREPLTTDDVIEVVDLHGRVVRTLRGATRTVIPRGDMAAGLYTVRVARAGKQVGTARVVVSAP